jgi:hypothetical protein
MDQALQYAAIISEIIAKQAVILGPDIAILKARNVSGLVIDDQGKVTEIKGEPSAALQKLVNEYVELSGLIVKNTLGSIFEKYPDIKKVE